MTDIYYLGILINVAADVKNKLKKLLTLRCVDDILIKSLLSDEMKLLFEN